MSIHRLGLGVSGMVPDFWVSRLLRLARTVVLLTSFSIGLLAMTSSGPAFAGESCPNEAIREAQRSTFLLDCRAYEMVSPPDKNGGDIMTDSQRVRASVDGSAATFSSLSGFGDVRGTSYASEYLAERSELANPGNNGWRTHGITPQQAPLAVKGLPIDPLYIGEFSSNLTAGIYQAWSPLTSNPDVANAANLYLRDDLRTPGAGHFGLITSCPLCAMTSTPLPPLVMFTSSQAPRLAGMSADLGHALFESRMQLTSDAPGSNCSTAGPPAGAPVNDENQCPTKLYESDHGTVRLAGIMPDGTPAPRSIAGQGAGANGNGDGVYTPNTISSDGRRIFFTVPDAPNGRVGPLYMRTDNGAANAATAQLNTSERTPPTPSESATYWDASADGSRIFFSSTEALTDDASPDNQQELYMYDASKPDTDPHNLTLLNVDHQLSDGSGGIVSVIGASNDGHYVYFIADGQLVAGKPSPPGDGTGIYVWHDDGAVPTVAYVAPLANSSDFIELTANALWALTQQKARVSPDGRHLLFSETNTGNGPTGYDQGTCRGGDSIASGCRELYVYSADTGQVRCASCNPSGAPATADATDTVRINTSAAHTSSHLNHPMSDDGNRVFFTSGEALVPDDINGKQDVYEFDVRTNAVHLISSGVDPADSYFMDASTSGDDAFFLTRSQLVGWDTDNNYDLYDARVRGGFPDPVVPPPGCVAGSCHALGVVPLAGSPGSLSLQGHGDLKGKTAAKAKLKLVCKKGKVRKRIHGKVRCVKKRSSKHLKSQKSVHRRSK